MPKALDLVEKASTMFRIDFSGFSIYSFYNKNKCFFSEYVSCT
jgi:hypothetical protein